VVIVAAIAIYLVMKQAPASQAQAPQAQPPQAQASQAPAPPSIVGTWKNAGGGRRAEDTISSLVISGSGSSLSMHAFGSCQPPPCDWGTQPAVVDGQAATATFNLADQAGSADTNRVASVSVTPSGGNLDVVVHNTFTEQGSSRTNQAHRTFVPGP
jgi:hypothetical protein